MVAVAFWEVTERVVLEVLNNMRTRDKACWLAAWGTGQYVLSRRIWE
jgi:hypothetical protein